MNDLIPYSNNQVEISPTQLKSEAIQDFKQSRANIVNIIDVGSKAINDFADLAFSSQNPQYYEVLASMIKAVGDSSKKLMDTHEQLDKIINKDKAKTITNNISNSNFISTTSDILKAMNKDEQ